MGDGPDIIVERLGAVSRVTLNRPHQMNSFTHDMVLELPRIFAAEIAAGARALILTGAGKAFSAGAAMPAVGPRRRRSTIGWRPTTARSRARWPICRCRSSPR